MIAKIPFSEIEKVSIYLNTAKKSVSAIKLETGADCILNGTLYDMRTFQPVCHLRADGVTACQPSYTTYGYAWDELPELEVIPGKRANQSAPRWTTMYGRRTPIRNFGNERSKNYVS